MVPRHCDGKALQWGGAMRRPWKTARQSFSRLRSLGGVPKAREGRLYEFAKHRRRPCAVPPGRSKTPADSRADTSLPGETWTNSRRIQARQVMEVFTYRSGAPGIGWLLAR